MKGRKPLAGARGSRYGKRVRIVPPNVRYQIVWTWEARIFPSRLMRGARKETAVAATIRCGVESVRRIRR
jgi:hypothetical protein